MYLVDPIASNPRSRHSLNPPLFKRGWEEGGIDLTKNLKKWGMEKLLNGRGDPMKGECCRKGGCC